MINRLSHIFIHSINVLQQEQPGLLSNTAMTTMTEWNLGHHLANVICRYINCLDCDLDCVKRNYDNRRPDIIFHRRGSNDYNFLVIELKINSSTIKSDLRKIAEDWQSSPLNYLYGACISIDRDWNKNGLVRTIVGSTMKLSETIIQDIPEILNLNDIEICFQDRNV